MRVELNVNKKMKPKYKYNMDSYYIAGDYEENNIKLIGHKREFYDKDGEKVKDQELYIPEKRYKNYKYIDNIKEIADDYKFRDITRMYNVPFEYFPDLAILKVKYEQVEEKPDDIEFDYIYSYIELTDGGKEEFINLVYDIIIGDSKYMIPDEYDKFLNKIDKKIRCIKSDDNTNVYYIESYINRKCHVFSVQYGYKIENRTRACILGDMAVYYGNEVYVAQYSARDRTSKPIDDRIYLIKGEDTVHNEKEFDDSNIKRVYDAIGPAFTITNVNKEPKDLFYLKQVYIQDSYPVINPENATYEITMTDHYRVHILDENGYTTKRLPADRKLVSSVHNYMNHYVNHPKDDNIDHRIVLEYNSKEYGKGSISITLRNGEIIKIKFPVSFYKHHTMYTGDITLDEDGNLDFNFHIWNEIFDIHEDYIKMKIDSIMTKENVADIKTTMDIFIEGLYEYLSFYMDHVINCALVNYLTSYFPDSSVNNIDSVLANIFANIDFSYVIRVIKQHSIIGTFFL